MTMDINDLPAPTTQTQTQAYCETLVKKLYGDKFDVVRNYLIEGNDPYDLANMVMELIGLTQEGRDVLIEEAVNAEQAYQETYDD